ncbi:flagellar hook assembly protein FlgD [Bacillus sp. H-16]|uniref:flagellar hook assembly protein FlgD n=1 Tax=Alteribacter salitolerans TaxID=2912333 RepID=UPI0019652A5B|nr:flagellar hook assembly protein FlgD [Alteribacter salitolerans]MBM7094177.1 flagellar hook assembly protein FlgD [Alteribacter salitolerans]
MVTSVTDSLYLEDYKKQQSSRGTTDLDKDAFLKILITQLQNQDPMNPMEDKEFIAQMAQFSSLEQMTNIHSTLEKIANSSQSQPFASYGDMIGKKIEWEKEGKNEDGTTKLERTAGLVTTVSFKDGNTSFIVDGEHHLSPKDVLSISLP